MKLHYLDAESEGTFLSEAPNYVKEQHREQGLTQALCGYSRKTTTDKTKVECKICKRILSNIEHNSTRI